MTSHSYDFSGSSFTPRLLLGLGVALFGVVLMLDRLGIVDAGSVLRFWPLILVAIGLQHFFYPRERAGRVPVNGIIWMALGGILLLNSFRVLRVSIWDLFWPAILIALGVRLMARPRRLGQGGTSDAGVASDDMGAAFAVLAGVKRVSAPLPFHGSEVTAFMGGAKIDLRQAILRAGEEAVVDVFVVMGGCELLIPPHWVVSAPVVAVLGGVDDKRHASPPTVIEEATGSPGAPPRLVIRGFVMMGGVDIRS